MLPMAKLMGVVDRIMNLLRETETVEEVISNQADVPCCQREVSSVIGASW